MPAGLRRSAGALAAAAFALGPGTVPASAHGEYSPTIRTFVDGSHPRVQGLDFRIVPGDAARLGAVNRTGSELAVMATGGEAFLRIGPRGVLANVNSIDWYRSGNPDGFARPPAEARIGGPPRWERVTRRPEWVWFDHRLHPGKVPLTREIVSAARRARLDSWTVPAKLGGRDVEVSGHVEYRPILGAVVAQLGSSPTPLPGIQATVLPGRVPGIFLLNGGPRPVTVIGREGEPFARIGPRGTEVNLRSPTHVDDQAAKGRRAPLPPGRRTRRLGGGGWTRPTATRGSTRARSTRARCRRTQSPRRASERSCGAGRSLWSSADATPRSPGPPAGFPPARPAGRPPAKRTRPGRGCSRAACPPAWACSPHCSCGAGVRR